MKRQPAKRFTWIDELTDHREIYIMLHFYRLSPLPGKFKLGISYNSKNRAADVTADLPGYVVPIYTARVRFAKLWEQLIHLLLKCCLLWAPFKKGNGRTEFFWIPGLPLALPLVWAVQIVDFLLPVIFVPALVVLAMLLLQ